MSRPMLRVIMISMPAPVLIHTHTCVRDAETHILRDMYLYMCVCLCMHVFYTFHWEVDTVVLGGLQPAGREGRLISAAEGGGGGVEMLSPHSILEDE